MAALYQSGIGARIACRGAPAMAGTRSALHCTRTRIGTHPSALRCQSTSLSAFASSRSASSLATSFTGSVVRLETSSTHPRLPPGLSVLSLDRPASKNAISVQMLEELGDAVDRVRFDSSTRVLILRSTVPGTFCAGADLKERRSMSATDVERFLAGLRAAFSAIERLPCPTVAALDGLAMGGGLEMALCADIRVAGPAATRLGLTETRLGIIPGAGGTVRLARLLGPAAAKDLIFSARLLDAQQARAVSLVQHIGEAEDGARAVEYGLAEQAQGNEGLGRAIQVAEDMLPNGPLALKAAKQAIDCGLQMDRETALDFERSCYQHILTTKDRTEGLRAFAEKRKPVYTGE